MRRKELLVFGALALGLLLSACGRRAAPAPTVTPSPVPSATRPATPTAAPSLPTATPPSAQPPPDIAALDLTWSAFRLAWDPQTVAEIWDFASGDTLEVRDGAYYAVGGDAYDLNVYERPFTPTTQDVFWPDLDLRYARLVREGEWLYAVLEVHGLRPGARPLAGEYGLEMDLDFDGQGDLLLWAQGPWSTTWSMQGVTVYADRNRDVGSQRACRSDAPQRNSDGYETILWKEGQGTLSSGAWARVRLQGAHPTIELAFPVSWVGGSAPRFLWRAWADAHLHDPGLMDYHDAFTRAQAGSPYWSQPPTEAIAQMDSTCYTTFGYAPLGFEPCVCRNTDPWHPLCPAPPTDEALGANCEDLGGGWAQCTTQAEGQTTTRYCHWDSQFCRWDCRGTPLCGGSDDFDSLAQQYWAFLQAIIANAAASEVQMSVDVENYLRLYECEIAAEESVACSELVFEETEDGVLHRVSEDEAGNAPLPTELYCVAIAPPSETNYLLCAEGPDALMWDWIGETIAHQSSGDADLQMPLEYTWHCSWDAAACRYTCGYEQACLDPKTALDVALNSMLEASPDCSYDGQILTCPGMECFITPDGTFVHCAMTSEAGVESMELRYNAHSCAFHRAGGCPLTNFIYEEDEAMCQPLDETGLTLLCDANWEACQQDPANCEGEEWVRCAWEDSECAWYCHSCDIPDTSCFFMQDRVPPWVCPGMGEFDNCTWSEEQCRWSCIGIHLPPPEGEEDECQPADYCREIVRGVYICGEDYSHPHKTCYYDDCVWICDGHPVP